MRRKTPLPGCSSCSTMIRCRLKLYGVRLGSFGSRPQRSVSLLRSTTCSWVSVSARGVAGGFWPGRRFSLTNVCKPARLWVMQARPATDRKTQRRTRLDHRRRGYLLDGELQAGFVDRPELPDRERIAIARWARSFSPDRLSDVQRELLDSPAARRTVSQAQRELQANQRELQLPYVAALSDLLSDQERRVVADPSKVLGKEDGYPLTVGQLARLTDLSERQVRRWADEELLPCFRDEGARRFYSAALIRAFALSDAPTHEKAVLSEAAQGHAGRLFALLAATLARTRAVVAPEHVESLDALAHELSNSSRLMTESRGDRPLWPRSGNRAGKSGEWRVRRARSAARTAEQRVIAR